MTDYGLGGLPSAGENIGGFATGVSKGVVTTSVGMSTAKGVGKTIEAVPSIIKRKEKKHKRYKKEKHSKKERCIREDKLS